MKKSSVIFWVVVTLLPLAGIIISLIEPQSFALAQETWRERIVAFGVLAPLIFILIQALQVILAPISHYAIGILGGFLYGPYLGALLNWIGRILGHIIAFFIARTLGRKIAEKFVSEETLKTYDLYVSDKSLILFLFYFLPVFPDDEISYLAGLSKMKFRMFFFANFFGHIGGSLGLAYLGSGIDTKDPLFWILTVVTLLGFPILWRVSKKKQTI